MHSMQEGHMDLDVVNIIHVSELLQPYENRALRLILVVTDPSDIAGVLSVLSAAPSEGP